MLALKKGDFWIKGVHEIKSEVKNHFQFFFMENDMCRPVLDGVQFT